jgi:hypothetical protein
LEAGDVIAIREALLEARLLVPIVALGEESAAVDMAVPRLIGADGRHALPVFSSADARPVPMPGSQAVAAALADGYAAIILDVAGPVPHTVELRAGGRSPRV